MKHLFRPFARFALIVLLGVGSSWGDGLAAQDNGEARARILDRSDASKAAARAKAAEDVGTNGAITDLGWMWEALAQVVIYEMNKKRALEQKTERIENLEWRHRGKKKMPPKAEERLAKLKKEREALEKVVAAEGEVAEALRGAMAAIFDRAEPEARRAAVAPFIEDFDESDASYRLAMIARTLGYLEDPASRRALLDQIDTEHASVRVAIGEALARQAEHLAAQKKTSIDSPFWKRAFGDLAKVLQRSRKTLKKLKKSYESLGKKFNRSTLRSKKLSLTAKEQALDARRHEIGIALADEESVVEQFRETLARIFAHLSKEGRADATAPLLGRLAKTSNTEERVFLIELLGPLGDPAVRDAIAPFVTDRAAEVRIVACEALGRQGDPAGAEALGRAIVDALWQVRSVAIDALAAVGGRAAVDALIIGMEKAEGRILYDISAALAKLTGQDFHENRVLWRDWWAANRSTYEGPPAVAAADAKPKKGDAKPGAEAGEPSREKDAVSFYGILTRSKRIVYILDVSGSMNLALRTYAEPGQILQPAPVGKRKIDEAISELKRSITSLPKDATFNIVFYSHRVNVWKKKQVEASDKNKEKATAWADDIVAEGWTNIFDALERAFGLAGRGTHDKQYAIAADTFYLLSDGRSNRGRVIGADAMLAEVKRLNKFQRVVIHTIGLGLDCDRDFMRDLAAQSGGTSKLITHRRKE